jgi:hypothetical protein
MYALPTTQRSGIPKTDLSRQGMFTKGRAISGKRAAILFIGNILSHWKIKIGVDEIT